MTSLGHQFMTSMEVADRLRITDSTIRAQIRKGKLTGVKRGGIWLFALDEVERYERENQARRKGGRPKSTRSRGGSASP
jgi:excisionase family DNA binding protein